jgi:REG-2-like HAD superfamily hydrolase
MIRFITLDVGGTLLTPCPSVGGVYARVASLHGVRAEPALLDERFRSAWKIQKAAARSMDVDWWRAVVTDVFQPFAFANRDAFFSELYDAFREPASWTVFPDVVPALTALRERGLTLAIASNWDDRLPSLLDRLGLARHFHRQFISFAVGLHKPDTRFFETALRELGAPAEETLHAGDDWEEDVGAARGAGIRALRIRRSPGAAEPGEIISLLDLVALVDDANAPRR